MLSCSNPNLNPNPNPSPTPNPNPHQARAGCNIIDFATASLANCTSQPSLNAFLAAMAGDEKDPGINYLTVEPYDMYWAKVRVKSYC